MFNGFYYFNILKGQTNFMFSFMTYEHLKLYKNNFFN